YEGQGIQIGAFVVQWEFRDQPSDDLLPDMQAEGRIFRLDAEVIARRMQQAAEGEGEPFQGEP
ncbi:MAG: hypothetical protein WD872_03485, partial [Pirellulaceae bacterium]